MVAGTPTGNGQNNKNLYFNHAYTILKLVTLESNGQRLIKFRNPWGLEKYTGAYSD
jgi:hypothetical protein